MKSLKLTVFLLGITLTIFGQASKEAIIRKTIEAEHSAFHTNPDRKIYMSYWLVKPETRWVYSNTSGTSFMTGADLNAGMAKNMYPPMDSAKFIFSNFISKASGTVGWASYDVKVDKTDGKSEYSHEFRCLEKIKGIWKIISGSGHQYNP